MSFFARKQQTGLGIDIGLSGVKLVELDRQVGRIHVRTYGRADFSNGMHADDPRDHAKETGRVIAELVRATGAVGRSAVVSVPTHAVFSSIIHFPELPKQKKDQEAAVRREVAKLISDPIEDMIVGFEVLTSLPPGMRARDRAQTVAGDLTNRTDAIKGSEGKQTHVLVTATKRSLVVKYKELFDAAGGITIAALETEAFALVRSLVGNDPSTVLIVDIGAASTDFSVIDGGVPVMNRSVQFGGEQVTKKLADVLKIPHDVAEQVKRDLAAPTTDGVVTSIPPYLVPLFSPLMSELQYMFGLYQGNGTAQHLEKIILTGGSSWLAALEPYLAEAMKTTVLLGDPWARVAVPTELKSELQQIGPRMNVAVGLAMRDV